MTRSGSENAVSFIGMKHLNTADITASYGVLRVRAAVVIAAVMAVLVFVGGANACHHNAETAEQTSTEVPQKADEKAEIEA
jgi:peptide subunit release factor 1 (eRF1)